MEYIEAVKALDEDRFPNKLMILGEESYLIRDIIQKIQDKYVEKGMEQVDISVFSARSLDEREFVGSLQSLSFFSEKRIVLVEDAQAYSPSEEAMEIIRELDEGIILIFLPGAKDGSFRKLAKLAEIVSCDKIKRPQMEAWIRKEMRQKKKAISPRAMAYLITQSRYFDYKSKVTLYFIKSEIDKLASREEDEISLDHVKALMQSTPDDNIFVMVEELSQANRKKVFKVYDDYVASGNSLYRLVPMMVRNYHQLLMIKVMQEAGMPLQTWDKNLGITSYYIKQKLSSIAARYTRKELLRALDLCLEREALYKSQSVDMHSLIQNLILELLHL